MGDKEVKIWLKEAREQIKNKEFKSALKEVKKVLNKDKNHYLALVFCGLCLSELDQSDQALQAYKRAVESSPDQAVGWEGLLKFYEKHKEVKKYQAHHVDVLQQLLTLHSQDLEKYCEVSGKLAQLQLDLLDLQGALDTLNNQAEVVKDDSAKLKEALQTIIKVASSQPVLDESQTEIFKVSLEKTVSDAQTPNNMENLKHLIKLLYKTKEIDQLLETAKKMTLIFSENVYPLEWLSKIFLEHTAGTLTVERSKDILDNINSFSNKLLETSPNSSLGILAQGALLFKTGDYEGSIERFKRGNESATNPNFNGLYLLTLAQFETKKYQEVEVTGAEASRYLNKVKEDEARERCRAQVVLLIIKSIYNQHSSEKLPAALKLIKEFEDQESKFGTEFQMVKAKVYASLGKKDDVEAILDDLLDKVPESEVILTRAILQRSMGEYEESKKLFTEFLVGSPENLEALVALGKLLWDQDNRLESLQFFLTAAKVDPSSWIPFLYLGQFYQSHQGGNEKARKCLSKCLQLNPGSVEAGMALSDLLRTSGRYDENLSLLTRVTAGAGPASTGTAGWAWLRLGINYLATDEPAQAVAALQSALRGDSSSVTCWEALADAYMARGSYNAARKAFEKVQKLGPQSCSYSLLMIAGIKHKLGHYREAIADYQNLLQSSPDYLPALRGLGESHLALGNLYLEQNIDKNVVDCAQAAYKALTRAAVVRPNLVGTWHMLGEAGSLLIPLSANLVTLLVPSKLVLREASSDSDSMEKVDREGALELAVRCYTKALVLEVEDGNSAGLWQDLALVYIALGQGEQAVSALKQGINLNPLLPGLWTSLGLVYARQENWTLAQHCLIRSLQLDASSAVSWTNLGAIYLQLGEQELANKAFKESQNAEPDYINGWTGQALVAEVAGFKTESMDLFRHCTFLGPEQESARGYGDWVCGTVASMEVGEKVEHHNQYIVEKMWGVVVAVDSLVAYTARQPDDTAALCQLGLLQEKLGLVTSGLLAMSQARNLLEQGGKSGPIKDSVLANLGRMLTKVNKCEEAVEVISSMSSSTLHSQVSLALAHFRLGQFQESYQAYESCLHWLADNDGLKSHILVAMGSLAYKVEGMAAAKTLLFQSCQLSPPSVRGLFSLCVIGVQNSDMNLIEAALSEMVPHEQDPRFSPDIAFLRASILVLKGDVAAAKRSLLSKVHKQPWLARLWSILSLFLLQNSPKDAKSAAKLAQKSSVMRQNQSSGPEEADQETPSGLVLGTLALLIAGEGGASLREAKVACHMHPHLMESWAVLAAAARMSSNNSSSTNSCPSWLPGMLSFVGREKGVLGDWAKRVETCL